MKTKEEIGKLAKEKYPDENTAGWIDHWSRSSQMEFIEGYTQCQEDNSETIKGQLKTIGYMHEEIRKLNEQIVDKKYTIEDMKKACAIGIDIVNKSGENDFQPFEDLINSLK